MTSAWLLDPVSNRVSMSGAGPARGSPGDHRDCASARPPVLLGDSSDDTRRRRRKGTIMYGQDELTIIGLSGCGIFCFLGHGPDDAGRLEEEADHNPTVRTNRQSKTSLVVAPSVLLELSPDDIEHLLGGRSTG